MKLSKLFIVLFLLTGISAGSAHGFINPFCTMMSKGSWFNPLVSKFDKPAQLLYTKCAKPTSVLGVGIFVAYFAIKRAILFSYPSAVASYAEKIGLYSKQKHKV